MVQVPTAARLAACALPRGVMSRQATSAGSFREPASVRLPWETSRQASWPSPQDSSTCARLLP